MHARFVAAGVRAVLVTGDMGEAERRAALGAYASGEAQVVVNVAVLTEGWDHPPTSCVVLLRPSSFKCTMIQMIGRGLRTVDPNEHPGVVKTDCVVLDFGTSTLLHGSIEQDVDLDGRDAEPGEAPTKTCPGCEAEVPLGVKECPLCGHIFEGASGAAPLDQFVMTEIDLLSRSSFRWVDLFGDDGALVANGFTAWGGVFFLNGRWHAVGGAKDNSPRLLGDRRAHGLPGRGRRLAERARDRRERAQVQALARPAADREAARVPAAGAAAGPEPHPLRGFGAPHLPLQPRPDPPAHLRRRRCGHGEGGLTCADLPLASRAGSGGSTRPSP